MATHREQLDHGEGVTLKGNRRRQLRKKVEGLAARSRAEIKAVAFEVDDLPGNDDTLVFVSPDGDRWKAYAYFPQSDEPADRHQLLVDENGDFVTDDNGEIVAVPIDDENA